MPPQNPERFLLGASEALTAQGKVQGATQQFVRLANYSGVSLSFFSGVL